MFCEHCGSPMPEGSRFCERCGGRVTVGTGTLSVPYSRTIPVASDYFAIIEPRLKLGGFTIIRNVPVTPWQVDLIATQRSGSALTVKFLRVILATKMEQVDEETIRTYSQIVTKYAQDSTGTATAWRTTTVIIYPVILTRDVPDTTKMWMRNTLMDKHYAAFEFPVLVLANTRERIYCTKTPFYGWALYKGMRTFAETQLGW